MLHFGSVIFNGHARRKKHVVELYGFVAHAQHNAAPLEGSAREFPKRCEQRAYAHIAGLPRDREPARWQDREDSGRDMEAEGRRGEGSNGRALARNSCPSGSLLSPEIS